MDVKRQAIRIVVFAGAFLSAILPIARAQGKNEIGLVIGAAVTPGRTFSSGSRPSASFDSSLALGAEYDHRVLSGHRAALYGGWIPGFAVGCKGQQAGNRRYWAVRVCLLDAARPCEIQSERSAPSVVVVRRRLRQIFGEKNQRCPIVRARYKHGTFVFGGGVDTRTVLQVFRIPLDFVQRTVILVPRSRVKSSYLCTKSNGNSENLKHGARVDSASEDKRPRVCTWHERWAPVGFFSKNLA